MQEVPIHYDREQILQLLGIKSYVLKFWETEFDCLTAQFNTRGEVFYTERDVALLQRIYQLIYQEKCSIERVRATLDTELKSSVNSFTDDSSGVMMESFPRLATYSEQSHQVVNQGIVVEEVLRPIEREVEYDAQEHLEIGIESGDGQLLQQMALETMSVHQFDHHEQPLIPNDTPIGAVQDGSVIAVLDQLERERAMFYHQRTLLQKRIQLLKDKLSRS